MRKCSICGEEDIQHSFTISFGKDGEKIPCVSTNLMECIRGHDICDNCMDIYRKIDALINQYDFVCGGKDYYADGRNLIK